MTVRSDHREIKIEDLSVKVILGDGVMVGIIVNDIKARSVRCFHLEEMSMEDIGALMEKSEPVQARKVDIKSSEDKKS